MYFLYPGSGSQNNTARKKKVVKIDGRNRDHNDATTSELLGRADVLALFGDHSSPLLPTNTGYYYYINYYFLFLMKYDFKIIFPLVRIDDQ